MSNIYIERNPKGQFEVKEKGKPAAVAVAPSQKEAEEKAHQLFPNVKLNVERVRHSGKGEPDKWRSE